MVLAPPEGSEEVEAGEADADGTAGGDDPAAADAGDSYQRTPRPGVAGDR